MELTTETFCQFKTFIYEQCGIAFADNKKYVLESRLQPRLKERNCATYEEYYKLIRSDAWRDKELSSLFNVVTTNETFFYRDLPQLQAFTDTILPAVMKANEGAKTLRIWSAACSTGDEPYTLAMMLLEHPVLSKWTIEILASDISEAALATARKAVYGQYAVRNIPPMLLKKYFTVEDGQYVLSPKVKALVRIINLNLYDSVRLKLIRGYDVILCRNCLIYFDDKAKTKILNSFYESLRSNGFLVIGFSESLHNLSRAFMPLHAAKSVVYKRL